MSGGEVIERIRSELVGREPRRAEDGTYDTEAAVSLMLRTMGEKLEFLAIQRSVNERDPWSGHMALPGGRKDPGDETLWETAVRETLEEIGVDLAVAGRLLGQLDDVRPSSRKIPAISITPFVVEVGPDVETRESAEVDVAIWVPAEALVDEGYRGRLFHAHEPGREFPTIEYRGHVIWGLTLSVLGQMEAILRGIGYPSAIEP